MSNSDIVRHHHADNCRNMKVYGSVVDTEQVQRPRFNVQCDGLSNTCIHSEFQCSKNSECAASCTGNSSCTYSTVIGGANSDLMLNCNAQRACHHMIVDAARSNTLTIAGCNGDIDSCSEISLECPPYDPAVKNCVFDCH